MNFLSIQKHAVFANKNETWLIILTPVGLHAFIFYDPDIQLTQL